MSEETHSARRHVASIVIPVFNEGERLPMMLHELSSEERSGLPPTEFLVVDDGSGPGHRERYQAAVRETAAALGPDHRIALICSPRNQGKGASVRLGWSQASDARWLGYVDGDGAIPAHEVWRLVKRVADAGDVDVVAGSRILMAGRSVRRNLVRHLQGRLFATLVDNAFELGFYDTQCGLKLLRAALLRPLLPSLREDRWMLDVELLLAVRRAGARCVEEPVDWAEPGGSKVIPLLDPLRMAIAVWRLRRRYGPRAMLPPARA
jgi:dolichyl-phosphate beta-glucosyltransferase